MIDRKARPRRVVVATEQSEMQSFLGDVLRGEQYEIVSAPTPIALMRAVQDQAGDAVLVDLPGGVELCRWVRTAAPDVTVILIGDGNGTGPRDVADAGAHGYLRKPVRSDELLFALHRLTNDRPRRRDAGTGEASPESALWEARRLEEFARLAEKVAHDLNNLVTVLMGYTDLLLEALPADAPVRVHGEEIRKAALRVGGLARQLLTAGRRPAGPRSVNLNTVILDIERMLRSLLRHDITLVFALDPDIPDIPADPIQVEQVIMNLVVNARDAMPRGGRLTLTTGVTTNENGPASVFLQVADTGCGMDAVTQARMFEPFFTTKGEGKGTGLGLAIVADVVKQHGGSVRVSSYPGRGSTFTVSLPLSQAREQGVCLPRPA